MPMTENECRTDHGLSGFCLVAGLFLQLRIRKVLQPPDGQTAELFSCFKGDAVVNATNTVAMAEDTGSSV